MATAVEGRAAVLGDKSLASTAWFFIALGLSYPRLESQSGEALAVCSWTAGRDGRRTRMATPHRLPLPLATVTGAGCARLRFAGIVYSVVLICSRNWSSTVYQLRNLIWLYRWYWHTSKLRRRWRGWWRPRVEVGRWSCSGDLQASGTSQRVAARQGIALSVIGRGLCGHERLEAARSGKLPATSCIVPQFSAARENRWGDMVGRGKDIRGRNRAREALNQWQPRALKLL
jgi:hypothetical protein